MVGAPGPMPEVHARPGFWKGGLHVPFVIAKVAIIGVKATVIGVGDAWAVVGAALIGILAGAIAWVICLVLFASLHPRFSRGASRIAKSLVVFCAPPVVALIVTVDAGTRIPG